MSVNGGLTVYGGKVTAFGGSEGAGIGGGNDATGAMFDIYGGEVTATGGYLGAAIGGGEDVSYTSGGGTEASNATAYSLNNGTVMIDGGVVELSSGTGYPAVKFSEGRMHLANELMVKNNGTKVGRNERVSTLGGNNPKVRVEPCTHSAVDADYSCLYCLHGTITAISLADAADNSTVLTGYDGKTVNVTLSGRTLYKDGSWNTLCLPFDVTDFTGTPLEGAQVKTMESASFNYAKGILKLNFTDASKIEAGKPYLVKWTSQTPNNVKNPVFNHVTISNTNTYVESYVVTFKGIFSPYAISGEDKTMLYLDADNKLCYPSGAMTIGAFRAYFELKGITAGDPATSDDEEHTVRAFELNFNDGLSGTGEETGITTTKPANTTDADGAWYDLSGRKMEKGTLPKGIYINKGRKIAIK